MCSDAGVELLYLAPYSPGCNLIEEFFAELKGHIKKAWPIYKEGPDQVFKAFLHWCDDEVGAREDSAEDYFRNVSITKKASLYY